MNDKNVKQVFGLERRWKFSCAKGNHCTAAAAVASSVFGHFIMRLWW